jgi:hypothetical protein
MKKHPTNIFFIFLFATQLSAQSNQSIFVDAANLAKLYEAYKKVNTNEYSTLKENFYNLLAPYGVKEQNIVNNAFLAQYKLTPPPNATVINTTDSTTNTQKARKLATFEEASFGAAASKKSAANFIEWQGSAINGVANFMAGRFKQELLQVAIGQIFERLKKEEKTTTLQALFPKTYTQINNLSENATTGYYTTDLVLLQSAAQIDLQEMGNNLVDKYDAIFPANKLSPTTKDVFRLLNYLIEYSQKGLPLDKLISTTAQQRFENNSTIQKIILLTDLFSNALNQYKNYDAIWANPIQSLPLNTVTSKGSHASFFYGLLATQLKKIPELTTFIEKYENSPTQLAKYLQDLLSCIADLNTTYELVKDKSFKLSNAKELVSYVGELSFVFQNLLSNINQIAELKQSFGFDDAMFAKTKNYLQLMEVLLKKDFQKLIPVLIITFEGHLNLGKTTARALTFLSQLALVNNAADMEAILNAYALPIGSASIKRNSKLNISLNSYVGISGGSETAYGSKKNQTKGNVGLTAPIGISTTFGGGKATMFVSVIDVGSVVNQRLNNNINTFPKLRFEHFFSPGIGLYFNCPKLPFTAGIQYSYIPNLRNIQYIDSGATVTDTNTNVTRLNLSILVDIPFFTLVHKN